METYFWVVTLNPDSPHEAEPEQITVYATSLHTDNGVELRDTRNQTKFWAPPMAIRYIKRGDKVSDGEPT